MKKQWIVPLLGVVLSGLLLAGCAQEQGRAASSSDTGSASGAAEQIRVPEPTEITGNMKYMSEEVAAVDAWLKDWVQIQGKHAEGSTLNDNMTILESKILRYGQSDVEAHIYYQVRCADDGRVYPVYEYIWLLKDENGWAPATSENAHVLEIGGYDGENGRPVKGDPVYDEYFINEFSDDPAYFTTPFAKK